MIPLPTPPVRGQRIQADLLRDLIAAVRRCRPIQGQGILLQETLQGTVITLAGRQKTAADTPFDHRFKVTCRAEGEADAPTYALLIRKGSLYEIQDGKATEEELTLEGLTQAPDDSDAWRVANASAGSLYIRKETAEGKEGYTLAYGEPTDALFVIADFTPSASSAEPFPKVTQHILGDLYLSEGASEPVTAAWTVRLVTLSDDPDAIPQWCVYAPTWVTRSRTLSLSDGWYSLPAPSSGTPVCAVLKMTVSADDSAAVTVDSLIVTDDPDQYQDVAPVPPSGTGSSSDEGTPGIAYWKVTIGTFRTGASGLIFDARHIGLIIADPSGGAAAPSESWCISPPEIIQKNGKPYQVAYYCKITRSASGIFSVEKTDYRAYEIECQTHGNDHKNGVL